MPDRRLPWGREVARMKAERVAREPIREERLRTRFGARCTVALSAWRGRSSRRYVVTVHPIASAAAIDPVEAVVLAVARDPDGRARILAAGQTSPRLALAVWTPLGTDELHVHRLAETPAEREAIVEDLVDAVR